MPMKVPWFEVIVFATSSSRGGRSAKATVGTAATAPARVAAAGARAAAGTKAGQKPRATNAKTRTNSRGLVLRPARADLLRSIMSGQNGGLGAHENCNSFGRRRCEFRFRFIPLSE